ncbi:hypothetical protein SAMN02910298_02366 [Pseudobutyrivibrio sp. YE44]|uniref:hypothetical protein n=1 Tax=Pseudobutyrivibrio sp. YE44 TaxID=1520802 RepID=UPI000886A081|nr:hypothetical protein [Pseudobutyrivibrio sp. YE44]SDB47016.1 hypothetical protein SAMN02910298_02366 [Pseudobutyrivibrio sp. YE44]
MNEYVPSNKRIDYGEYIEKYSEKVREERIAYESSPTSRAYRKIQDYYDSEIREYISLYYLCEDQYKNYNNIYDTKENDFVEYAFRQYISAEDEAYINSEYEQAKSDLTTSQKILKNLDNDLLKIQVAKDMVEQIQIPEDDPSEPDNPGTEVDPGQSEEPDKPDTPASQPSVNIDMNVNVTINIVDEHTVNIDFSGHVEIRCVA